MLVEAAVAAGAAAFAADHGRTPWDALFDAAASRRGVPANLLRAIARIESSFRAGARSHTNDYGIMQVNAATLRSLGVPESDWLSPGPNIDAGARYLLELTRELGPRGNLFTLPMAYHVGPDLRPQLEAERYASRVLWHWLLYDIGRLGAPTS